MFKLLSMCPVSIDQIMPFVERMVKVGDLENVGVLGILFSGSDWFYIGICGAI